MHTVLHPGGGGSCGSLRGTVRVFLHAQYDPHHPAPPYAGALYAGDQGGRDDGGDPGVPKVCGFSDHIHCKSGLQPVHGRHPCNGDRSPLVGGKRSVGCYLRPELCL